MRRTRRSPIVFWPPSYASGPAAAAGRRERQARAARWLVGLAVLASVMIGLPSRAAADDQSVELVRMCYVVKDAKAGDDRHQWVFGEQGAHAIAFSRGMTCVETGASDPELPVPAVDPRRLADLYPFLDRAEMKGPYALVECAGGGTTAAKQTGPQLKDGAPVHEDQLAMLDACAGELGVPVGAGADDPIGDALGIAAGAGGGRNAPASSAMSCATDPANPKADFFGGSDDIDNPFVKGGWAIYRFVSKSYKAVVSIDPFDLKDEFDRYQQAQDDIKRDVVAIFAADVAQGAMEDADDAAEAADLANAAAAASNDPDAKKAAADAQAAATSAMQNAKAAEQHAQNAKKASNLTDATKEWAAADAAADKAAQDKKKAEEAAAKAGAPIPAPSPAPAPTPAPAPSPTPAPTPTGGQHPAGPDGRSSLCPDLQRFVWECEQSGWKTGPCKEFLDMLNHCGDTTQMLFDPEGGASCGAPPVDAETLQSTLDRLCGLEVAHVYPGSDPCHLDKTTLDPQGDPRGCDDTLAHTVDGRPCDAGDVQTTPQRDESACPPPPPGVPPFPCPHDGGPPPSGGGAGGDPTPGRLT